MSVCANGKKIKSKQKWRKRRRYEKSSRIKRKNTKLKLVKCVDRDFFVSPIITATTKVDSTFTIRSLFLLAVAPFCFNFSISSLFCAFLSISLAPFCILSSIGKRYVHTNNKHNNNKTRRKRYTVCVCARVVWRHLNSYRAHTPHCYCHR